MTCRHSEDDPSCSSYKSPIQRVTLAEKELARLRKKAGVTDSPDNTNFDIDDVVAVGPHLVLRVVYPNCAKCVYEGKKVLVYLNVTVIEAMKWRSIDPHFRAMGAASPKEAPPPAARFPASDEGWRDALAWAQWKTRKHSEEGCRGVDIHEGGTR